MSNVDTQRVVVITGAAQGIGKAIAERLTADDRRMVLIDRNEAVKETAAGLRAASAEGVISDLSQPQELVQTLARIRETYGRCDILVNNAGINPKSPDGTAARMFNTSLEAWEQVLTVNLTATFLTSQWALEMMKEQGWGRIVNMASRAGRIYSAAAGPHYSASKAGIIALTRAIAGEGGPYGITANSVAPGRIATPLTMRTGAGTEAAMQKFLSDTPVGRVGEAWEVAAAVAYLASDDAAFVTGAVIDINGGSFG